jgi:DNA excision repair protein ERCC-2
MDFCPDCKNILYHKKNSLFCKVCNSYYRKKGKILTKIFPYVKKEHFNPNSDEDSDELKFRKIESSKLPTKLNYLHYFPYAHFRKFQEDIIKQIEENAENKKIVLLVAPNGTGKTIIALSSLLPLAIEKKLKILYLCRTHAQNTRVIKELIKISQFIKKNKLDGIKINGLSIRGRNEMCLNKTLLSLKVNPKEAMSICSDLRNNRNCKHFLNLIKKRSELEKPTLIAPELFEKPIDAEDLINFCKDKKLCPYFLSKFLLEEMKVIICNYQWVFNPYIRETFLNFIGSEIQNCILVIDECHNIIDVATEVNSERITPYSLRICLKDLEMYRSPVLMQSFVRILSDHLDKKKELLNKERRIQPDIFLEKIYKKLGLGDLNEFKNFLEDILDFSISIHEEKKANGEISRDYLGSLAEFWLKWIDTYILDSYFFCYNIQEIKNKKAIALEILALDPREITIPILKNSYTCLNLSGTVNPYVFNNLMGFHESGKRFKGIIADSPFKKKNIKAIITMGVNTRRENRVPNTFNDMVAKISEVLCSTPSNVGIFCASYKILDYLLKCKLEEAVIKCNKKLFVEDPQL